MTRASPGDRRRWWFVLGARGDMQPRIGEVGNSRIAGTNQQVRSHVARHALRLDVG